MSATLTPRILMLPYRGRPPRIDLQAIQYRLARGLSPTQIARELGVSRGTVYKARAAMTHGA